MDTADRALAFEQIRQLAARYSVALDARDLDALVALYVPDVRISSKLSGRDALRELMDTALRGIGVSFLNIGTHVIDIDEAGETATGVVYCRGEIQDGGRDSDQWITHLIQYHDSYTRLDGQWYFGANRKHLLVAGYEQASSPLGLPPAEWPKNQIGMGSVPADLQTWQEFWKEQ